MRTKATRVLRSVKTLMPPQWGQPAARRPPLKAHCTLLRDPSGWRQENWRHVRLAAFKISQAASAWWAACARRPTTKERSRKR